MPQLVKPSVVKIVPKDGELEITLNINITIDGVVTATADKAAVTVQEPEEKPRHILPNFTSGLKLDFGKNGKA